VKSIDISDFNYINYFQLGNVLERTATL